MHTNCQRCGRPLKDPKSRARGFGPICFEKFMQERLEMLGLDERPQEKPEDLSMPYEKVKVDDLRLDGGTQPRVEINQALVEEYAGDMAGGAIFPPVVVFYDGENYWLADGFHRVMAAALIEREDFYADLREGTLRDAILYSCGANATHGLRRSNADKRAAVEKLLCDEEWVQWSDREIARRCGVSHTTVANIREELVVSGKICQIDERTAQRGDTTYTVDTSAIGQREPSEEAAPAPVADDDIPFPEIDEAESDGVPAWLENYRSATKRPDGPDRVVLLATGENAHVLLAFDKSARLIAETLGAKPQTIIKPEWGEAVPVIKLHDLHKPTMDRLEEHLEYFVVCESSPSLKNLADSIRHTTEYSPGGDLDDIAEPAPGDTHPDEWPEPAPQPRGNHRIDPLMQSGSDEWYTPEHIVERVRAVFGGRAIALDPCSTEEANQVVRAEDFWTKKDDGLDQPWYCSCLYMNPPYGDQITAWVEKLVAEFEVGRVRQAIALLPARTDTAWFRLLAPYPRCFLHGRLQFWGPGANGNTATFPSVVVALGCDLDAFAGAFADVGDVYVRYAYEPVPLEEGA